MKTTGILSTGTRNRLGFCVVIALVLTVTVGPFKMVRVIQEEGYEYSLTVLGFPLSTEVTLNPLIPVSVMFVAFLLNYVSTYLVFTWFVFRGGTYPR